MSIAFGGDKEAREALNISRPKWDRLGKLASDAPLLQGRHRGQNVGQLGEATDAELEEAREIARKIVEAYFDYLEGKTSVK